jgi:hypothetical protein
MRGFDQGTLGADTNGGGNSGIPSWCGENHCSPSVCPILFGTRRLCTRNNIPRVTPSRGTSNPPRVHSVQHGNPRPPTHGKPPHHHRCHARPQRAAPLRGTSHMKQRKQWLEVTPGGQVSNFAAPPIRKCGAIFVRTNEVHSTKTKIGRRKILKCQPS